MLPDPNAHERAHLELLRHFLLGNKREHDQPLPAISLFSGAGLSDLGYEQAGFKLFVQAELDPKRAALCQANFPESSVIVGDITTTHDQVVAKYQDANAGQLQLLTITPPCQGMSSSNPGRGKKTDLKKRDKRNHLLLEALPVIEALEPRFVVIENVSQILSEVIQVGDAEQKLIEVFETRLNGAYTFFKSVAQMADYGIPQVRKRAVIVAVRQDEACLPTLQARGLLPVPQAMTQGNWITIEQWFQFMNYSWLDGEAPQYAIDPNDRLHFVPSYEDELHRYVWIMEIPPRSGQNAYQNVHCWGCGNPDVPVGDARCPTCNEPMTNRPYVEDAEGFRLVKGFKSSYRRMYPDRPAPTVTTNSSHMGSDYKLHPWEHRTLSVRECADLQTIPYFFNWDYAFDNGISYTIRTVVGEALPPYFAYLHGNVIRDLLENHVDENCLESVKAQRERRA